MAVSGASPGIREGLLGSPASPQFSRGKHVKLTRLAKNDVVICLQEIHGKDEFQQANQVLVPQFRKYGTFIPNNLSAGGSAVCINKNLLPEGAIVTHVVTSAISLSLLRSEFQLDWLP